MKASDLLAGGLHDLRRFEKATPAQVTTCEPLAIRPDGSFQPMLELDEELAKAWNECAICAAFGTACCRVHRGEVSR